MKVLRSGMRHSSMILAALAWLAITGAAHAAGHPQCSDCHRHADPEGQGPELTATLPDLCINCHAARIMKGEHPSGIEPGALGTGGLPLVEGLISCSTCHDPHGTVSALLRLPGDSLCTACHDQ